MLPPFVRRYWQFLLITGCGLLSVPVVEASADTVHFQVIELASANGLPTRMQGQTGGSFSLNAIANQDRFGQPCVGFSYAADVSDHEVRVRQNLATLKIRVESRDARQDTTLLIEDRNGFYYCADDEPGQSHNDAMISLKDVSPGTYRIWVGHNMPSQSPPSTTRYTLWLE